MGTLGERIRARSGSWDESKHPRGEAGRWGFSTGGIRPSGEAKPHGQPARPEEFRAKFEAAMKDSPFANHVSHYSLEELGHMKPIMNAAGTAGCVIKDHGDGRIEASALFSTAKGEGLKILSSAIKNYGANYVECYSDKMHTLDGLYAKLGFKEVSRDPFNTEYAAPGWDYKRFPANEMTYVTMKLPEKAGR